MKQKLNTVDSGVQLLTGNEAISRGAWEYGVHFAAAYPGTPSTEILETVAEEYDEIDCQWAPNEKVSLEVVAGASFAGARVLCAMKHVGLNVAADPLFTLSYLGVKGGMVIITADDPSMHSSQNEQDNRLMGKAAKVIVLEPSDSQEAKDMVGEAIKISEEFDTPVLIRLTTRICHSKSLVEVGPRKEVDITGYEKNIAKYVPIPSNARKMHTKVEARLLKLSEYGADSPLNRIELGNKEIGIITGGVSYQYVKEVYPEASVLKIGICNPLPWKLIEKFIGMVSKVIFVEENEPFLEEQIRSKFLIDAHGKKYIPREGELNPELVRTGLKPGTEIPLTFQEVKLPARPPALCPGCPHRGAFYILSKLGRSSTGDIGCYTLGLMPPYNALETTVCMGAAIGVLSGIEKATGRDQLNRLVSAIGESTFVHSGITGLIDMVYNGNTGTVMIMDNSLTAMTGGQENPTTGKNLKGEPAPVLDMEEIAKACGVKHVHVIDPHDLPAIEKLFKEEMAREELSVIITKRPCIMCYRPKQSNTAIVDKDRCIGCRLCMKLGCPAISWGDDEKPEITPMLCWPDCNLCVQVCPVDAISLERGE